jgi:hypothetical protein
MMPGYVSETICLPVEVYEGAGGDLVLCQEFPDIKGEAFVRIFVDMDQAEKLCAQIMGVARVSHTK